MAVPCTVVEKNKVVTMAADIFFVNRTPFLVTLSRNIKFVMVEHLPVRSANALVKHIKRLLHAYGRGGFSVRTILMDEEFEKIKGLLHDVECNTTAAKEHVSKAKRMICTIKERVRWLLATLPFEHIPWRMKIEFIYFIVLWLMPSRSRAESPPPSQRTNFWFGGSWTTRSTVEYSQERTVRCRTNLHHQTR